MHLGGLKFHQACICWYFLLNLVGVKIKTTTILKQNQWWKVLKIRSSWPAKGHLDL